MNKLFKSESIINEYNQYNDSALANKLRYLSKLFDSLKTRMSIIEDENSFLRTEYSKLS